MKNYVYIYYNADPVETVSEESMARWMKWFESLGDKIVDSGNPFNVKDMACIKEGAVDMDFDPACGYSIVKASNLEEAVTMAKTCPLANIEGCWVRVYETMPM